MKRWFPNSLTTLLIVLFIVALTAIISIGAYSTVVLKDTLISNAEQTALSNLKSFDSILYEKIKNIQRFVDLVSIRENLHEYLQEPGQYQSEINAMVKELSGEFEEIESCVFVNSAGGSFVYNLPQFGENDLIKLQIACAHLSEKPNVLTWCNIDYDTDIDITFNNYVICGTNVYNDNSVKLFLFINQDLFDTVIENSANGSIVALLDDNGRLIATGNESLFFDTFYLEKGNIFSLYEQRDGVYNFRSEEQDYIAIYSQSEFSEFKFLEVYPTQFFYNKTDKIIAFMVIIIALFVGVIALLYLYLHKFYAQPLKRLGHILKNFDSDTLHKKIEEEGSSEIRAITACFNKMLDNIHDIIAEAREAEIDKKDAELAALRYQIRPHFLYNTLNSIRILALYNHQGEIANAIQTLARLLKNTISAQNKFSTLSQEFAFIKDYIELMQLRYKNMIAVSYSVDPAAENCLMPNMILQPLVENAIGHGLAVRMAEKKVPAKLYLSAQLENGCLMIEVTDNGTGISKEQMEKIFSSDNKQPQDSIGLKNIIERIKLLYGSDYGITIDSKEGFYTTITIRLPEIAEDAPKQLY